MVFLLATFSINFYYTVSNFFMLVRCSIVAVVVVFVAVVIIVTVACRIFGFG